MALQAEQLTPEEGTTTSTAAIGAFKPFVPRPQPKPDSKNLQPAISMVPSSVGRGEIRSLQEKELLELGRKAKEAGITLDTPAEKIKIAESYPVSPVSTSSPITSPAQTPTINQTPTTKNVLRPVTLAEKHNEMLKRDEQKYRLVYENKKFIERDTNKTEAERILGEKEIKETTPPTAGWKPESLDPGYIRKYSQGVDLTDKKAIEKDEGVRKEAINTAIDSGVPIEEVKDVEYTPENNALKKIPIKIEEPKPVDANAEKKKRMEEVSSVMGTRITKLPKSWTYFILPFAIGLSTGYIDKSPTEQNLGAATVPGMTTPAEASSSKVESVNAIHTTPTLDLVKSPESKAFLKLAKERSNSELIISKVPSYFEMSNPATFENSSKILGMKVKDILNKPSFSEEQTQKEVSDLLKETSLAFGSLSEINPGKSPVSSDESLTETNDTVEEYLNRLRTKIS